MSPEKKAIITASITAILLIIIKTVAGIMTGSMAILTSATDSTLDFFVSLMNFFAIKKSEQPHDDDYNYGHGKIEGFGALFEGLIIFFSGSLIVYFSVEKILTNNAIEKTDESIYVMILSIIMTFILVKYLSRIAKSTNSLIIKSDLLHYKTDLLTNLGIIISLIIMKITNLSVIDPIISIGIALYIMYGSLSIIGDGYGMLMDIKIDQCHIDFIKRIISEYDEIDSFHFLKTRKSGKKNFIEFHMVFKNEDITLKEAHKISDQIEIKILEEIPHSSTMIHLDYFDDSHAQDNPKIKKNFIRS